MNNILHMPSTELKKRVEKYKLIHDSEKRLQNNTSIKHFEEELKKLAWVKVTSNAMINSMENDLVNGSKQQSKLTVDGVSNIKLQNYCSIYNIAKNSDNNRNVGGFEELYSDSNSTYAFRPNAFIESIGIQYTGDLGSIIKCDLSINCSTLEDFEIINELYANPSVSLIIEWGYNTDAGMGNMIKDYSMLWKVDENGQKNYENIIKSAEGDYGAIITRVTNVSFSLDTSGSYKVTLGLMSRGISEMFADVNNSGGRLEDDISSLSKVLNFISDISEKKDIEYDVDDEESSDDYYHLELTKKIVKKLKSNSTNSGFIKLSALLNVINLVLEKKLIKPTEIYTQFNRYLMPTNFKKVNFIAQFTYLYELVKSNITKIENLNKFYTSVKLPFNCDTLQVIKNDANELFTLKRALIKLDEMWLNLNDISKKIEKSTSLNNLITSISKYIQDNTIGNLNFQLKRCVDSSEYMWELIDKNFEIEVEQTGQPLYIPVYGKNSIVSSVDVSGSLQDGLAQTVLYSKQEQLGNTIGNIWQVKNDKFINYLRASEYKIQLDEDEKNKDKSVKSIKKKLDYDMKSSGLSKLLSKKFGRDELMKDAYYKFKSKDIKGFTKAYKGFNTIFDEMGSGSGGSNLRAIFPLSLSLEFLFGNNLFTYGTLFAINYLPKQYSYIYPEENDGNNKKNQPCFYIKGITHNISGFKWTTSIEGNLTLA